MEFDDIFENKRKYHEGYRQSRYHEDKRYQQDPYPTYYRNNPFNLEADTRSIKEID